MRPRSLRWTFSVAAGVLTLALGAALAGCQAPWMKKDQSDLLEVAQPDDLEPEVEFVGDLTRVWGLQYVKVESIALVTRLRGTGSDPPPGDRRESLRMEMKANGVENPDRVLALDSTAMVFVKAFYPPGAQKGDPCDVIVEAPPRSDTKSLRDGWLMATRLRPVEKLGNVLRQGKVLGAAQGPVIVDAVFQGEDDPMNLVRGRVLGGGKILIDRPLNLVVIGENHSLMTSSHVAAAVNRRFFAFDHSRKIGAAEAKEDDRIDLKINPTYKNNLGRYLRVVQSIAIYETQQQRIERLQRLEGLLREPISSARAALRLEAIGKEAIPILTKGAQSPDPEVRFYSAEALAYLDESDDGLPPEAMTTLVDAAANSRAFRWHALTALSVIKHASAYEALTQLLHAPGVETRCGALRALQTRSPRDPLVQGEMLGDPSLGAPIVKLVSIPSVQEPLVHFLRYRAPQVAIFGHDVQLRAPFTLFAGKEIIVKSMDQGRVKITRFAPGEDERRLECSPRLDDVVRNIVALGGGYADVYQAVSEAKRNGVLLARVEVNALPSADRKYDRSETPSDATDDFSASSTGPLPDLFYDRTSEPQSPETEAEWVPDEEESPGFWSKMKKWVYPW